MMGDKLLKIDKKKEPTTSKPKTNHYSLVERIKKIQKIQSAVM